MSSTTQIVRRTPTTRIVRGPTTTITHGGPTTVQPSRSTVTITGSATDRVSKAGDTMTGALVINADAGLTVPVAGGAYPILQMTRAATDGRTMSFRDSGQITGGLIRTIWEWLDINGSQITGIQNDGGQFWTDGIKFLRGGAIHAQTAYWPQIRLAFLNQSQKRAPALIFSYVGDNSTTVPNLGDQINVDAGNQTWIRLTDANALQTSVNWISGVTTLTTIGQVGPGGEPGISAQPYALNGPVFLYRRTAGVWRTNNALEVNGLLNVADSAAGVPGIAGLTTTNTGIRFDATNGLVVVAAGADRWRFGNGGALLPTTNGTNDIGAAGSARVLTAHITTAEFLSNDIASVTGSPQGSVSANAGALRLSTNGLLYRCTGTTNWEAVPIASDVSTAQSTAISTAASDATTKANAAQAAAIAASAQRASNLSDLASASTARTNLGLGGAATLAVGTTTGTVAAGDDSRITGAAQKASNLSDLASASTARTNLGLGGAATLAVGTTTGTVAAGDDSRITGAAQKASNLSDLASASTARTNLGLGSLATLSTITTTEITDHTIAAVDQAQMPANTIKANATNGTADEANLALTASTVPARLASGNIVAATPAQILALMGLQAFSSPANVGNYSTVGGNTTTGAVTLNQETAIPIMFNYVPGAASKLAIYINSTVATSVLRVGVRNDAGLNYPYPGTLINECASTFSGSAATGKVEQAITWTPTPNVLYWLSAVSQTAAANVVKTNAVNYNLLSDATGLQSIIGGYAQASITGALGSFSATVTPIANPIRVAVLF